MKKLTTLLAAGLLLAGCTFGDKLTDANPMETAARDTHSSYLKSNLGFGLDSGAPIFYDSFETGGLGKWLTTAPSNTSISDAWSASSARSNYGQTSATFGGAGVISQANEFGDVLLTTKDTISLVKATDPALVFFALFDQQGSKDDATAFKVELSSDLGFTWTGLVATQPAGATDSVVVAPLTPERTWVRYRYSLKPYAGQVVRLRIGLRSSMGDRKLIYLDDVLIAENK